jgi:hypothetical protein
VERKYRDREQRENYTIVIPVIICPNAQARGNQYTKRCLPEFLIPHSVIRLDHLLEASNLPRAERTEAAICELIGCLDPRTARYQMRRLTTAIQMVSLDLTRWRAARPELGDTPTIKPGTPPGERLAILFDAQIRAGERAGEVDPPPALRQLLQAAMWKQPEKIPSISVSRTGRPP